MQARTASSTAGLTLRCAGVRICRTIGTGQLRNLDPFLMLDELKLPADQATAGFPTHPHRGFETVSIMLSGRMEHKDSQGNHVSARCRRGCSCAPRGRQAGGSGSGGRPARALDMGGAGSAPKDQGLGHPHGLAAEPAVPLTAPRIPPARPPAAQGVIGPGGVQWMTAGRGIIHSEMPVVTSGMLHGFQLWVNLPAKDKVGGSGAQQLGPGRRLDGHSRELIGGLGFGGAGRPARAESSLAAVWPGGQAACLSRPGWPASRAPGCDCKPANRQTCRRANVPTVGTADGQAAVPGRPG
jgi:hypothetical protein